MYAAYGKVRFAVIVIVHDVGWILRVLRGRGTTEMQEYLVSKRSSPRIIHDAYGMRHAVTDSKHPWKKKHCHLRNKGGKISSRPTTKIHTWKLAFTGSKMPSPTWPELKAIHCSTNPILCQNRSSVSLMHGTIFIVSLEGGDCARSRCFAAMPFSERPILHFYFSRLGSKPKRDWRIVDDWLRKLEKA